MKPDWSTYTKKIDGELNYPKWPNFKMTIFFLEKKYSKNFFMYHNFPENHLSVRPQTWRGGEGWGWGGGHTTHISPNIIMYLLNLSIVLDNLNKVTIFRYCVPVMVNFHDCRHYNSFSPDLVFRFWNKVVMNPNHRTIRNWFWFRFIVINLTEVIFKIWFKWNRNIWIKIIFCSNVNHWWY